MSEKEDRERISSDVSPKHEKRNWRSIIYGSILVIVFLAGFVPTCTVARRRGIERDTAQAALRISSLQNTVGNAIVDTRTGNFERARQGMSEFFTNLRTEVDGGRNSIFDEAQEKKLRALLEQRDDTITALARSDPASPDRLTKLYIQYREAVVSTQAP
jgi:hypothetical protein